MVFGSLSPPGQANDSKAGPDRIKDKISFSGEADLGHFQVINFPKRQVVANGHL